MALTIQIWCGSGLDDVESGLAARLVELDGDGFAMEGGEGVRMRMSNADHQAQVFSTGSKPNDFFLHPAPAQPVSDLYRRVCLLWSHHHGSLRLRHFKAVTDDLETCKRETKLFTNHASSCRWRSVSFKHPSTIVTVAMDPELKSRVKSDLALFLKGLSYYAHLGQVWKRIYLLHDPSSTGKSTFVAAMTEFRCVDVYELDLWKLSEGPDLKSLLLQTSPKSVILVEYLDRYLANDDYRDEITAMINFIDGVFLCCGEDRVMVFMMSRERTTVDPTACLLGCPVAGRRRAAEATYGRAASQEVLGCMKDQRLEDCLREADAAIATDADSFSLLW